MAIKTYTNLSLSVSANFTAREFACKHCNATKIDDKLITYVQKIRTHFGKPVIINSGYRCVTHNKNVGGTSGSYHLKGMAADIVVKDVAPAEVAKYAESIGILGIGLYDTFVHIDTRTSKSFWYGQGQASRDTFGGRSASNNLIKSFQDAAKKDGFSLAIDGIYGPVTESVMQKAVLYLTKYPWRLKNLTKFAQSLIGVGADGKFGAGTKSAVINFQKSNGLAVDGIIGLNTWKKMLGV